MLYAVVPLEGADPKIPKGVEDHKRIKGIYLGYAPKAWIFAFDGTTDELTDLIWPDDLDEEEWPIQAGIVIRMNRYNGWATPDLWEWLGVQDDGR